jgi:hypothetical protein
MPAEVFLEVLGSCRLDGIGLLGKFAKNHRGRVVATAVFVLVMLSQKSGK